MSIDIKGPGGGENVTPEVTERSTLVAQILESLVGKAARKEVLTWQLQ